MGRLEDCMPAGSIGMTFRMALKVAVGLLDGAPCHVKRHLELLAQQCGEKEHARVLRDLGKLSTEGYREIVELALSSIIDQMPESPADLEVTIMETREQQETRLENDRRRN